MISSDRRLPGGLCNLLEGQLEVLRELRGVMSGKQELLVHNDVSGLSALAKREELLALRLRRLETQRLQLVSELSGISPEEAAEQGFEALPEDSRADPLLTELSMALRDEIHEVQELQFDNRLLTERLVEYGSLVMRLMTQGEEQPGYNSHGRHASGPQQQTLLNCRV